MTDKLTIHKKPELAKLEEHKKIRAYEEGELNKKLLTLTESLLSLLGVSGKANTKDHVRAMMFIKDSMKNYSFEEIIKAFDMFVAGEFHEKPMQQFNSVVVGKVMREYQKHKDEKLKVYRQKLQIEREKMERPTEEEVQEMINNRITSLLIEFQNTGTITGVVTHIYEHLMKQGKLAKHTKEYKAQVLIKAKKIAEAEAGHEAMKSFQAHRALKATKAKIDAGTYSGLKPICQRIAIIDYFKTI